MHTCAFVSYVWMKVEAILTYHVHVLISQVLDIGGVDRKPKYTNAQLAAGGK